MLGAEAGAAAARARAGAPRVCAPRALLALPEAGLRVPALAGGAGGSKEGA